MKAIKFIISFVLLLGIIAGCTKSINEDVSFVDTAGAPAKLSVVFNITQDNSGLVTITPNGEGAVYYEVFYGHGTTTAVNVPAGKNSTHTYPEGVYDVKIIAHNVNGKTTELIQKLTVSFRAPEDLVATVAIDAVNNFRVNVYASALYETFFRVFWGDVPNEAGQSFLEGQNVNHIYAATGTYTVRVVAYSGGAATTTYTTTVNIVDPILIPITFESATVNYAFTNFGGATATKIPNPQINGINTSANVGRMVKNAPEVWAGALLTVGGNIDFSTNKVFRMKVFSPRVGARVLLKVENLTNGGIFFEKEVTSTVANAWEDMAFDFRTINTANAYSKVVIICDNGVVGNGTANFTWLFDDIRLTNQMPVGLLDLPVTFDLPNVNYEVTDFGGAVSVPATDPTNGANNVKRTTKPNGAETWAGSTMGAAFTSAIPFTATRTQMSIRVYSPAAGIKVRLKVEDRTNNARSVETEAMTQAANTWETLIFDFATPSAGTASLNLGFTYNMASVFFDFGTGGSGREFLWDDVTFLATNVIPNYLSLPIDFQATYAYPFVNFGGATSTVVNNPNPSGINTSTKVGRMVKGAPEGWAGGFLELVNSINFSTLRNFRVKVYSPRAGARLLLKVENPTNGAINFEREVAITSANTWEELSFDFSTINIGNTYSRVVLFFDFGTPGDGSPNYTFFFDDIRLN
jgi:hypothetical protein